jgi:predicted phosphoadenosine phosphosulfate sulfurtransferase
MDPKLPPTSWVRQPPPYAEFVEDKAIELMVNPERFPVEHSPRRVPWSWDEERQCLINIIGLRVAESRKRLLGLFSSGSFMAASNDLGTFNARPIYDWADKDVWRFISENKLPYCPAYDVFYKMGETKMLRIGPPTLNVHSLAYLQHASKAWPRWFDRVAERLPGIRTAVQFGRRACEPYRRYGETWEQCFHRECLGRDTPDWIRVRAEKVMLTKTKMHKLHSSAPFPESMDCFECRMLASWKSLAMAMWGGDPYALKAAGILNMIEPSFFRPDAGTWAGKWAEKLGHNIKVLF